MEAIKVSRKSLNYRLWERWRHVGKEPKNPCRYFWFSVFQWTIGIPVGLIILVVVGVIMLITILVRSIAWFFGFRPDEFTAAPDSANYSDYKYDLYNSIWRGGYKSHRKRYRIAPWEAVVITIYLISLFLYPLPTLKVGAVALAIFVVFALPVLLVNWRMAKEYLKAKKAKYCPPIELVD